MRLFIASPVLLDDYEGIRKDFEEIIEGNWVKEENLHLTWIFLGETDDPETVMQKLYKIKALEKPVEIEGVGYFGRPPRVLYAKAESKILYDKAREFKEAGFDFYRFKPHITLCRIKKIHNYKVFKDRMQYYKEGSLGKILPQIHLYRSQLDKKGAHYSPLL